MSLLILVNYIVYRLACCLHGFFFIVCQQHFDDFLGCSEPPYTNVKKLVPLCLKACFLEATAGQWLSFLGEKKVFVSRPTGRDSSLWSWLTSCWSSCMYLKPTLSPALEQIWTEEEILLPLDWPRH